MATMTKEDFKWPLGLAMAVCALVVYLYNSLS